MTDKPITPTIDLARITEYTNVCAWYDARIAELERTLATERKTNFDSAMDVSAQLDKQTERLANAHEHLARLKAEVASVTADLKQRTEAYESSLSALRNSRNSRENTCIMLKANLADAEARAKLENGWLVTANELIKALREQLAAANARTPRTVPSHKGVTYNRDECKWHYAGVHYASVARLVSYFPLAFTDDDHAPILALRDATPRDVGEAVKSIRNVGAVVQRICDEIRDEEIGPYTSADKILAFFTGDAS